VRFSDDDGGDDEGDEELTCRSRGKGKGKANETRNKRAASKPPGRGQSKAKKAASKKKETKAAKEYRALISEIERMRGRGGTNMTTGIKGSGARDLQMFVQR
jgi:hypothetical protein